MPTIEEYLKNHAEGFEQELCELLRIPSVSTKADHREDMRRAARWIAERFRPLGFAAEIVATAGHPIVYAESPRIEGAPTILVYGHYDVQPVEPLELWTTPPFEPTRRDGNLYARGATDDKGQVLTHLFSAQAWLETKGKLPVNLKYLIEGEEEIGSDSLLAFLPANTERLACDCVVISDGSQFAPGYPAITYGLRGIAYFDLILTGPDHDLHSGTFGGAVTNPANALAKMLAALVNEKGQIQVPGFYDDVVPLTPQEREQFASLPFDEKQFLSQVGASGAIGEEGYTTLERRWARPTCDINGLYGGYQGQGAKTVLPSQAGAKFSFRLVPHQDPAKVAEALRGMLTELCPPGIKMELIPHHGAPGVLVPLDSPYVQAAARAIEDAFGRRPVFAREGGSIPIVTTFYQLLHADTLLIGWGQDDDNAHSPNEKFSLADFHRGIRASAQLWEELGKIPAKM
jgi:acetylornithine deacetylase/succinyl-diaminopimelate desuccinylase-like protein